MLAQMFVTPPHAPGRCLIPLTDVLFFAPILEYDRRGRAAKFRNTGIRRGGGDHAQTDDVPARRQARQRSLSAPMIWRERAAKRMQEGIPVSPDLLNQLRQIAQVCAAPRPPVDKMRF